MYIRRKQLAFPLQRINTSICLGCKHGFFSKCLKKIRSNSETDMLIFLRSNPVGTLRDLYVIQEYVENEVF